MKSFSDYALKIGKHQPGKVGRTLLRILGGLMLLIACCAQSQTSSNLSWSVTGTNLSSSNLVLTVVITLPPTNSPPASYTISASAGTGGSISPSGNVSVNAGGSQTFTATPSANYVVNQWLEDGSAVQTGGNGFTLLNVEGNHSIQVTFAYVPPSYTVSASAGTGGSVNPSGSVSVTAGNGQTFTATPGANYVVNDWLEDGNVVQTNGASFTLLNVQTNHSIQVTFTYVPPVYTLSASAGTGGSINPSGSLTVNPGSSQTFTATPYGNYLISQWLEDGNVVQTNGASFTLSNIEGNHSVQVTFAYTSTPYLISAGAGAGGNISPRGSFIVNAGDTKTFTAVPSSNYVVNQWLEDGNVVQTNGASFTLSNIEGNHSVQVTFTYPSASYTLSASAGTGGTINPGSSFAVNAGANQTFTATPNANYVVNQWLEDGNVVQNNGTSYTLSDVQGSHSIQVTFTYSSTPYTINASAGTGGTISPTGSFAVNAGDSQTFTATPDTNYVVNEWLVDGNVTQTNGNSFTLLDVEGNHSVQVTFTYSATSYTLSASAGTGGSINPGGSVTVNAGGKRTFTATPYGNYIVSQWLEDGNVVQTNGNNFTLFDIENNHSIQVTFAYASTPYLISADAGAGGRINPGGSFAVNAGDNQTFTAFAYSNYVVNQWLEDGNVVQTNGASFTLSNIEGNHSVQVTFTYPSASYTISASPGANGSINPSGSFAVNAGDTETFTATPDTNYVVSEWLEDGNVVQTNGDSFTILNIETNHSIQVTFAYSATSYTLSALAGTGGSINPGGSFAVNAGDSQTFTATPDTNYVVNEWLEDGNVVQTNGDSLTLLDVETNHSVEVTFTYSATSYTLSASAGTGGSINPGGTVTVNAGGKQTFTATPYGNYVVNEWLEDGNVVQTNGDSFTVSDVETNHSIEVTFTYISTPYLISAGAGVGGKINPSGSLVVNAGASQTFTAVSYSNYVVNQWLEDGNVVQTSGDSFTLSNVEGNHSIQVTFAYPSVSYTLNASAGTGGSINPSGSFAVNAGANQTFTATPDANYVVNQWLEDGNVVQTNGDSFTVLDVETNHSIQVTFTYSSTPYTLSASAGTGGTISPTGSFAVNAGDSQTFTATPDTNYVVNEWLEDGNVTQTNGNSFTLLDVEGNHSVQVTFTYSATSYTISTGAGNGGSINPGGSVTVSVGANPTFTATPYGNYVVNEWLEDGNVVQTNGNSFTLFNVGTNHNLQVTFIFASTSYLINTGAGTGGNISPRGNFAVSAGSNQTFTARPYTNYVVNQWLEDGNAVQTGGNSYTLLNVEGNHSIQVTFAYVPPSFAISASAGTGGSINPGGSVPVTIGGSQTFTATPSANYVVNQWLEDGNAVQTGGVSYTLSNVEGPHSVQVTFTYIPPIYTLSASAGTGGSINPTGSVFVTAGNSQTFTATPGANYVVNDWLEDGNVVQTNGDSFTVSNVETNHSIEVTFTYIPPIYTITASTGTNGSINPSGSVFVTAGNSQTFTATPASTNYVVNQWLEDGNVVQTSGSNFTLLNVETNHSIQVTFSSAGFTPVSGYYAWWNPDAGVATSSGHVTNWVDQSGNALPLGQSTVSEGPTVATLNGHKIFAYNGSSQWLTNISATVVPQPLEIFIVLSNSAPSAESLILANQNPADDYFFCENYGGGDGLRLYCGADLYQVSQMQASYQVVTFLANNLSSQIWTNGVPLNLNTGNPGRAGSQGLEGLEVSGFGNGVVPFPGQIGDIIIYTNTLSTSARQSVENGLRAKYGF